MRLLLFSDLHCDGDASRRIVERSAGFDVLIGAGDFATMRRGLAPVIGVLGQSKKPAIVVPGNSESADELRDACRRYWPAANVLHGAAATIDGVTFFGVGGGVPVTPFGSWSYDFTEAQAAELLAPCPDRCVLVTHSPPKGCLDIAANGASLGSTAIRAAVESKRPRLLVCGHIHASAGRSELLGDTPIVNAGPQGMEWTLLTIYNVYQHLLADVLTGPLSEDDALNLMMLIHLYRLELREPIFADRPTVTARDADTQRGAASVIADLWRQRDDPRRTKYEYWYGLYNTRTPYEDVSEVPPQRLARVEYFRSLLLGHPKVAAIVLDV